MKPNDSSDSCAWWRRFLASNPFYPGSAALLLWGVYLLSNDPDFLPHETGQLAFNFCAVEIYEALLVATAVLLAGRMLWQDATLLAGIETVLLPAPFILISQAALIDAHWVWGLCGVGFTLAVLRGAALKRWFRELNLAPRLLVLGGGLLALNATLPILYRLLHESKYGTRPDFGAAYLANEWVWLLGLPFAAAAANFLPTSRASGRGLPGRRWLPFAIYVGLLVGTGVHLWSLGYVYDFAVRRDLVAPALWVLAWTMIRRIADFVPEPSPFWRGCLWILPWLAALLPARATGHWQPALLAALNTVGYAVLARRGRDRTLAIALLAGSVATLIASLPMPQAWAAASSAGDRWGVSGILLALVFALAFRHPLAGCVGALALAGGLGHFLPANQGGEFWVIQGLVTLLVVHSLRWETRRFAELAVGRRILAVVWLLYGWVMILGTEQAWPVSLVGAGVCLMWAAVAWRTGEAPSWTILGASVALGGTAPALGVLHLLAALPGGLLILAGSIGLFALGTGLALTRPWWHATGTGPER